MAKKSEKKKSKKRKPSKLVSGKIKKSGSDGQHITNQRWNRTDETSWIEGSKKVATQSSVTSPETQNRQTIVTPVKSQEVRKSLFLHTTILLVIAIFVSLIMATIAVLKPETMPALAAIGGVGSEDVTEQSIKPYLFLDTLFPVFYGAGFAGLAVAFQNRGNRPLIRFVLTAILIAVVADFTENALVLQNASSGTIGTEFKSVATMVKYAVLALSGVAISMVIQGSDSISTAARLVLRYGFPVAVAILVTGWQGEFARNLVGMSFPVILALLALLCWQNHLRQSR